MLRRLWAQKSACAWFSFYLCSTLRPAFVCVVCARSGATRYLNADQFVNAIAPKGDLTKLGRSQFATLFPVADSAKRGLVSWDDFVVFQTILKRPDADYWIAFQYFDVFVLFLALLCMVRRS